MEALHHSTARQLREALGEGRIGAEELVRAYRRRIEKHDGRLNTVAELDPSAPEQARKLDAAGQNRALPLFGLPVLVKDNIDVKGLHTTAGSLSLADNVAAEDAPVIANLRRNGAVILGKTNMTEFANYTSPDMPNGYSSRGGQVIGAFDPAMDPGGSSTGSAVAVSAGFCAAAVGTDTSFSIVGCATQNGVTGLKPAHGSLPGKGIIPISHTLDSAGPLTRDAADAWMLYSSMRASPLPPALPADPRTLRLAVNIAGRDQVSDSQLARYETLFQRLRGAGVRLTEVLHPPIPYMGDLMRCEFRHDLEAYLRDGGRAETLRDIVAYYEAHPEPMMAYGNAVLRAALGASGNLDDPPYRAALAERDKWRRRMREACRDYDACVMTGPTEIPHFTGLPSMALRLCMTENGQPRGVILYGADEARLISAALTIESFCDPVVYPEW